MPDLFDYLRWRGDLPLDRDPLNVVDSMILCRLSYLFLNGVVPGFSGGGLPLAEAAALFFAQPNVPERLMMKNDGRLFNALAISPRFRDLGLSRFVDDFNEAEQKQFAALTITMGASGHFLSFRGTDDTFVGWKEDFNLGCLETIPSQQAALEYFQTVAEKLPGPLYLGGHSKGGNIALYAALHCGEELQRRIAGVYNLDGPGFRESVLDLPEYRALEGQIHTYVPQSSVIGMLLFHEESYHVVKSIQTGILQHDLYSWQVLGSRPITAKGTPSSLRYMDKTLREWAAGLSPEDRNQFVDGLYDILTSTNTRTLSELRRNAVALTKAVRDADAPERAAVNKALGLLIRTAMVNLPRRWEKA